MERINNANSPKAPTLLSQAVEYNGVLETSGQIGMIAGESKPVDGFEAQTRQTLENIKSILTAANYTLDTVAKVRIYLTDMKNYAKFNEVYMEYFKENLPARTAIGVQALPLGALVEIECTAYWE